MMPYRRTDVQRLGSRAMAHESGRSSFREEGVLVWLACSMALVELLGGMGMSVSIAMAGQEHVR
jgi:hypothetical protein